MVSDYARSIGVTESDAHTARNIHLSVGDCKHLAHVLKIWPQQNAESREWTIALVAYLRSAV